MDQIQQKFIEVQGLELHVAEIGSGPNAVVFLHGFPEMWFSWRHQLVAGAEAGFRALAPDFRGYGLSDPPLEPEKACYVDLIKDLGALLDALGIDKVFLVAKDFGASPAYLFSLLHQETVRGIVTLGVPYCPPSHLVKYHEHLPEGLLHFKMEGTWMGRS